MSYVKGISEEEYKTWENFLSWKGLTKDEILKVMSFRGWWYDPTTNIGKALSKHYKETNGIIGLDIKNKKHARLLHPKLHKWCLGIKSDEVEEWHFGKHGPYLAGGYTQDTYMRVLFDVPGKKTR